MPELTNGGQRRIYRILCYLAQCDGAIDPRERDTIERYRHSYALESKEALLLESEAMAKTGLALGSSDAEQRALVTAMIDIVTADGVFALPERERLGRILKKLGIAPGSIEGRLVESLEHHRQVTEAAREPASTPAPPPLEGHKIETSAGLLTLEPIDDARRERLDDAMPFGFPSLHEIGQYNSEGSARYALAIGRGSDQITTIKRAHEPTNAALAEHAQYVDKMRLARALGSFLETGYKGLCVAGLFMQPTDDDRFESGYLFLVSPDAKGAEAKLRSDEEPGVSIDAEFGAGASGMAQRLFELVSESDEHWAESGIHGSKVPPAYAFKAPSVAPRSSLGMLWLDFAMFAGELYCTTASIDPAAPFWRLLRIGGVERLFYAPSLPLMLEA
jgi:hypothetical protein